MNRIISLSMAALLVSVGTAQTPVFRKGVPVQMPATKNAVTMPGADLADSVVVTVTFRGTVFLEATTVTSAQLSEKVKADLRGAPDKRVYIRGDARTPYSAVVKVLDALRTAGVKAPILVTKQHDSAATSYVPPAGLEVLLPPPGLEVLLPPPPDAAQSTILRVGNGEPSNTELKQQAQRDRPVVLQVDEEAPFGDVVRVVDECRGAGAKVYLATPGYR